LLLLTLLLSLNLCCRTIFINYRLTFAVTQSVLSLPVSISLSPDLCCPRSVLSLILAVSIWLSFLASIAALFHPFAVCPHLPEMKNPPASSSAGGGIDIACRLYLSSAAPSARKRLRARNGPRNSRTLRKSRAHFAYLVADVAHVVALHSASTQLSRS
jgi:hypothetical protein